MTVRWVEVTVLAAPPDVEPVAEVLRQAAPEGVVIEPAILVTDGANFEYHELDAPSTLRACVPAPFDAEARRLLWRRLSALQLSSPLAPPRYAEVDERDWSEEWKRFFGVLHAGERLVVRPSWEQYDPGPGEIVIALDPGQAFGTGQHESTRLCLAALERHVTPGADVIDVGSGSGILSVAAALLGARSVRALDTDPATLDVARGNVERNGVQACVRVAGGSLGKRWPWPEPAAHSADVAVANISSWTLEELMPALAETLRPGGVFIGGGFTAEHADAVAAAAAGAGLRSPRMDGEGEWRCLEARAPGGA